MDERIKKIKALEKKESKYIIVLVGAELELTKIRTELCKLRIIKTKNGHDIICEVCKNIYSTSKDPNAESKNNRPQCPKCGTRVKRKEPVKRKDVSKRLKKMHRKEKSQ